MSYTENQIDQVGRCLCGAVEFHAKGKMLFNQLCHCRACTWAASASPVHLIGVPKIDYTKGKDKVVETTGLATLVHGRCSQCMTMVYQKPAGAPMVALFPPTFRIGGDDSLDQKLPSHYLPAYHANYENRAYDVNDDLPKYKAFPPKDLMNNDGTLK